MNLLASCQRPRAAGGALLREGARRGQAGETLLANGQSLHGLADSCGSDRRFLPGETWVAGVTWLCPSGPLGGPRGTWDRYRLGHRPVRTRLTSTPRAGSMYSQAAVSSANVAARAVLHWDGIPEKGRSGRPDHAGTFGGPCLGGGGGVPGAVAGALAAGEWARGGNGHTWASRGRARFGRSAAAHAHPRRPQPAPHSPRGRVSAGLAWALAASPSLSPWCFSAASAGAWVERGLALGAPEARARGGCPTLGSSG